MKKNIVEYTLLTLFAMIAVALTRLMPHPFNFTPVAALALYGGAKGKNSALSFLLPLAVMAFSDILVMYFLYPENGNPFAYFLTLDVLAVYVSFLLIAGIGMLIKQKQKAGIIVAASLVSSLLFYGITNLSSWYQFYPHTFEGLSLAYLAGIPFYNNEVTGSFFLNQFAGDLFFNTVLFGAHAWVAKTIFKSAQA